MSGVGRLQGCRPNQRDVKKIEPFMTKRPLDKSWIFAAHFFPATLNTNHLSQAMSDILGHVRPFMTDLRVAGKL